MPTYATLTGIPPTPTFYFYDSVWFEKKNKNKFSRNKVIPDSKKIVSQWSHGRQASSTALELNIKKKPSHHFTAYTDIDHNRRDQLRSNEMIQCRLIGLSRYPHLRLFIFLFIHISCVTRYQKLNEKWWQPVVPFASSSDAGQLTAYPKEVRGPPKNEKSWNHET